MLSDCSFADTPSDEDRGIEGLASAIRKEMCGRVPITRGRFQSLKSWLSFDASATASIGRSVLFEPLKRCVCRFFALLTSMRIFASAGDG